MNHLTMTLARPDPAQYMPDTLLVSEKASSVEKSCTMMWTQLTTFFFLIFFLPFLFLPL